MTIHQKEPFSTSAPTFYLAFYESRFSSDLHLTESHYTQLLEHSRQRDLLKPKMDRNPSKKARIDEINAFPFVVGTTFVPNIAQKIFQLLVEDRTGQDSPDQDIHNSASPSYHPTSPSNNSSSPSYFPVSPSLLADIPTRPSYCFPNSPTYSPMSPPLNHHYAYSSPDRFDRPSPSYTPTSPDCRCGH